MGKKVLIGTVTLDHDIEMDNREFAYAASFEVLKVEKGEYPIYAYVGDLDRHSGTTELGWRNYIDYEGTVVAGNVGNEVGAHSHYHTHVYNYELARRFLEMRECNGLCQFTYNLRPEWGIAIYDFVSQFDNRRIFTKGVVLKDEENITYM